MKAYDKTALILRQIEHLLSTYTRIHLLAWHGFIRYLYLFSVFFPAIRVFRDLGDVGMVSSLQQIRVSICFTLLL